MKERVLRLNFLGLKLIVVLFFVNVAGFAQTRIQVTNESNEVLIGVLVFSNDYSNTFVTDDFGQIHLPEDVKLDTLHFKYLGYADALLSFEEIKQNEGLVQLANVSEILDEVLFIGRTNRSKDRLTYQIETVDQKKMQLTQSQTTVDALSQHANVFVQKSQMGGGIPVIRGFEANKVLLVVDGVRMNNAIYRSGHLQNAITIDQSMLERMEVIYGPNSLLYGSDALGGVVHFRTKKPKFNYNSQHKLFTETHYNFRYSSASNERTGHLDFNLGGSKFASLTSLSFSDYGDLRTGSKRGDEYPDFGKRPIYVETIAGEDQIVQNGNPNLQIGTSYSQYDLMQKFLIKTGELSELVINSQYSTSSDVPRYDQLTEPEGEGLEFAEWYYGPQKRFLTSVNFNHFGKTGFYDTRIIAAFQKIDEDRVDRKFNSELKSYQEEDVKVWSVTADFTKHLFDRTNLVFDYGIDLHYNQVESNAFDENIFTQSINDLVFSRYPSGGSDMTQTGAYAEIDWEHPDSTIILNGGLRFNTSNWNIRYSEKDPFQWPDNFYSGINSSNNALTWSLGSIVKIPSNWIIQSLISSAFRSPNIDDLGKIRVKGDEVSIPNPKLNPEKSFNFELSLSKKFNRIFPSPYSNLHLSFTGFYTKLSDAIIREFLPLPGGSEFLLDEGDTLYTVANVNAKNAYILGWSANSKLQINKNWNWSASINFLKARVKEDNREDSPLSHIPPVYGKLSSNYMINDWEFKALWSYNLQKKIEDYGGSEDNLDKATPEGTPGWSTINLYIAKQILPTVKINLGFENILDKHYRPFASGVSAPGFNAIVSLNGRF